MSWLRLFPIAVAVSVALTGCSQPEQIQKIAGPAQGSTFHISYWSTQSVNHQQLEQQIQQELDRIDVVMSNYRPDSTIEKFNQQQTTEAQTVGAELVSLVEEARKVYTESSGCYDLTVKPLFDLWGFKADKFNQPTAEQLQQTMQLIGMNKVLASNTTQLQKQNPHIRVDVSSIAQGYTVDKLADVLRQAGIDNFLVEVGGEMVVQGHKPEQKPWRVAIDKPLPGEQSLQKIIAITQDAPMSVMTSGTYRHYFDENGQRYSHVLDARVGAPVKHQTVSTTVLMDNGTQADAWSTAFLCLGSAEGLAVANKLGIKVLFIDQDGEQLIEKSSEALSASSSIQMTKPE
ncbi:MAG TPA: FAD:protein FMN transferase [Rheinheimera sp.]|nr:FAD:protein FMN transferase [Rheinheimera sp.]